MFQDIRFGFRLLRRNPGFSAIAILCLLLGIGANTVVLSWIEGVMLRPYPSVDDEENVFVIAGTAPEATKGTDISWPDFKDFERGATTIQAFIADRINGAVIGLVDQKAERAPGSLVARALVAEVRTLDASLTPDQVMTMREQINRMNQSTAMAVMTSRSGTRRNSARIRQTLVVRTS
jgi:hypothetical protein